MTTRKLKIYHSTEVISSKMNTEFLAIGSTKEKITYTDSTRKNKKLKRMKRHL